MWDSSNNFAEITCEACPYILSIKLSKFYVPLLMLIDMFDILPEDIRLHIKMMLI